jgi:hypothetical protein
MNCFPVSAFTNCDLPGCILLWWLHCFNTEDHYQIYSFPVSFTPTVNRFVLYYRWVSESLHLSKHCKWKRQQMFSFHIKSRKHSRYSSSWCLLVTRMIKIASQWKGWPMCIMVYWESYKAYKSICVLNTELNIKAGSTYSYHWALMDYLSVMQKATFSGYKFHVFERRFGPFWLVNCRKRFKFESRELDYLFWISKWFWPLILKFTFFFFVSKSLVFSIGNFGV